MEMSLDRADLLGSALLLWSGAALLALYLLCNPMAAMLREPFDLPRLWGIVLGLIFLGAALPARHPFFWLLFLGVSPFFLLPTPLNRRWGTVTLAGAVALGVLFLAGCRLHRRKKARLPDSKGSARRKRAGEGKSTTSRALIRRPGRRFRPRTGTEYDLASTEEEVKRGE